MAWLAWVQLNSVFLFSPSQAMSESRVIERIPHFLRYLFEKDYIKAYHPTCSLTATSDLLVQGLGWALLALLKEARKLSLCLAHIANVEWMIWADARKFSMNSRCRALSCSSSLKSPFGSMGLKWKYQFDCQISPKNSYQLLLNVICKTFRTTANY